MVDGLVAQLEELFIDTLPGAWSASVEKALRKLCAETMQLFLALHSGKSTFGIQFIPVATRGKHCGFLSKTMQSIFEDEDDLEGRPLMLSVFPAVFKNGDEFGNKGSENVICQARVLPHKVETS